MPIAPDVFKKILSFQPQCTDGYLVPGANPTEQHEAVYRRHSKWVSQWIKDHTKTSYELRRYAGSRLLDMGATIFEVRDFLRHQDVQTTQIVVCVPITKPPAPDDRDVRSSSRLINGKEESLSGSKKAFRSKRDWLNLQ